MRETGYYWVKLDGELCVGRYISSNDRWKDVKLMEIPKDAVGYWGVAWTHDEMLADKDFQWIADKPILPPACIIG